MGRRLSAEASGATFRLLEKQFASPSALVNPALRFNGAVMEEGITRGEASQANRKDLYPGEETDAGSASPLFLLKQRDTSRVNVAFRQLREAVIFRTMLMGSRAGFCVGAPHSAEGNGSVLSLP
ncbi:hypothetical protein MHYP_G00089990 [Metynnis hypsauchen]